MERVSEREREGVVGSRLKRGESGVRRLSEGEREESDGKGKWGRWGSFTHLLSPWKETKDAEGPDLWQQDFLDFDVSLLAR